LFESLAEYLKTQALAVNIIDMKKTIPFLLAVLMLLISVGCEPRSPSVKSSVDTTLYADGTKAVYNVFIAGSHAGEMTYEFTHIDIDGSKALKISHESDYTYIDPQTGITQDINSKGDVIVDFKNWKPISSNHRLEWEGDISGWQETGSDYGDGFVSWIEKNPAGSGSQEIEFVETFEGEEYLDEDEVVWHIPTLKYKPKKKKYFTYFSNRSGQPLQGVITLGEEHDIAVSGDICKTYGAGIAVNEFVLRLWFEIDTGRLIKYEQNQGYIAYPDAPDATAGTVETYVLSMTLTLKEWIEPNQ